MEKNKQAVFVVNPIIMLKRYCCLLFVVLCWSCSAQEQKTQKVQEGLKTDRIPTFDTLTKTIHVYVALCDNKYQGIVPVPEKIGNGRDPDNNLYWGCAFGFRTFFKGSQEWKLLKTLPAKGIVLQRLVFKHTSKNVYLVADAYDGKYIKECTKELLSSCAGMKKDTLGIHNTIIGIGGNAALLAYIGHDGLMDFSLNDSFVNLDGVQRDCIILACVSKSYFSPYLINAKVNPLVWSTGLMSPEAYTLHAALNGYLNNEKEEAIRSRAAIAYAKYQKCSEKAAKRLLVTGW